LDRLLTFERLNRIALLLLVARVVGVVACSLLVVHSGWAEAASCRAADMVVASVEALVAAWV
jgi:hypothetical protein